MAPSFCREGAGERAPPKMWDLIMFETRKKFPCSRVPRFLNLVHLIVHIRFVSKIGRCSRAVRKALLTAIAAAGIAKVPRRIQTAFGSKPKPRDSTPKRQVNLVRPQRREMATEQR